jgi:hypothetical protein
MSEIFETQFEGKTVKRKFYDIPSEKVLEFQNALGVLPTEFLTFNNGLTYKICAQYSTTKLGIEKSYEGVVYLLPEEPANLIIGVDENGLGGVISPYIKCIEEFDEYLNSYGYITNASAKYVENFDYIYNVTDYWDYNNDKLVYDTRFIRKICEDYLWSYSLKFDNIILHKVNRYPQYKLVNLNLIGNSNNLPESLITSYSNNKISLYLGQDEKIYKKEYINDKVNYVCIENRIKNEDILKVFYTIYKNYLNPNFQNSYPFYEYLGSDKFYKLNSVDSFYQLHKINDKYFLTHYDFNDNTLTFNNQLQQLRDNLNLKEQESQNLINNFYFNNRNDAYSLLNENQTIDYLITFNFAKNLLNGMTGLDAKYVRSVSLSVMKFLNETQTSLKAYDSSHWTTLYNNNQQDLIRLQNMISTGLNGFGDPLSQNEITEINRLISVSPQISEIYNTLSILNNTLLTYAFTPQSDSAYYMLLDFQNYVCQNPNIMSINPTYVNLLTQFGLPEENITETRITHINHLINVYKEKLIQLKQLTINPIFLQRINPATNESYTLDLNQNLQILLNDALNLPIIGILKEIVDLENQIYLLELNETQQTQNEIICKDLIVLKNIINNSPFKINQNIISDLNLSSYNLQFNSLNSTQVTPEILFNIFSYSGYTYDQVSPSVQIEYTTYDGFKINVTEDKCWLNTISNGTNKIKFKFFDYTLMAKFFKNYNEESTKVGDKITINASPRLQFKDVIWGIGTEEVTGNFKYNLINERNPADNKFTKISLLYINQVGDQLWHLYVNNNLNPLFSLQPKDGITLTYDPSKGFIHNESTTELVDSSGIILTRLNLDLENDIQIYIKCNAANNDILETVITKLTVKKQ